MPTHASLPLPKPKTPQPCAKRPDRSRESRDCSSAKPGSEPWSIDKLRESPYQSELFRELSDAEVRDLAVGFGQDGLEPTIEILPDGTIVDGHQRVRAAKLLGWTHIKVIVRHDLAAAGAAAVQLHMIAVNLNRRHMGPLDIARVYRRLKELARADRSTKHGCGRNDDLRDRLAKRLGGRSGRTLDRYEQLLDGPRWLQDLVADKRIGLTNALRVLALPEQDQEKVHAQIREGRSAKHVINDLREPQDAGASVPVQVYRELIDVLQAFVDVVDGREERVVGTTGDAPLSIAVLETAMPVLGRLLVKEREVYSQQCENLANRLDEMHAGPPRSAPPVTGDVGKQLPMATASAG